MNAERRRDDRHCLACYIGSQVDTLELASVASVAAASGLVTGAMNALLGVECLKDMFGSMCTTHKDLCLRVALSTADAHGISVPEMMTKLGAVSTTHHH